ncbi:MAG: VWA domain-containing protein [Lachnospiraceae bacterium]|nr:VWA domain-containing protein [Lachnospiraceae bacterium]
MLDNSLSIGRGNLAICRETIRYIADNADNEISLALSVFGEDIGALSDYGESRETLKERLDAIELMDRDTKITDNLTELLLEWKKADLADRCIILFTDGEETEPVDHEREEMYFLLERLDYPVYVVDCVTKKEVPHKLLSAVSTISSGELLYTEFEDSEAGVEKKLGDKLLSFIEAKYLYTSVEGVYEKNSSEKTGMAEEERPMETGAMENEATDETGQAETVTEDFQTDVTVYAQNDLPEEVYTETYEYQTAESLAGNEISIERHNLMKDPADIINILCIAFFSVIAVLAISLAAISKKRKAERRKNRTKTVKRRITEEQTECLKEEPNGLEETMLLFAQNGTV